MARTNLLSRQVGGAVIELWREVLRQPVPDPGYDMPTTLYIVHAHASDHDDPWWGSEYHGTYGNYSTAKAAFAREVEYQAVATAKRAMRRAA